MGSLDPERKKTFVAGEYKVVQKSKEAKMKAAMAGGRSKKKKWSKGKVKEKLANLVRHAQSVLGS